MSEKVYCNKCKYYSEWISLPDERRKWHTPFNPFKRYRHNCVHPVLVVEENEDTPIVKVRGFSSVRAEVVNKTNYCQYFEWKFWSRGLWKAVFKKGLV